MLERPMSAPELVEYGSGCALMPLHVGDTLRRGRERIPDGRSRFFRFQHDHGEVLCHQPCGALTPRLPYLLGPAHRLGVWPSSRAKERAVCTKYVQSQLVIAANEQRDLTPMPWINQDHPKPEPKGERMPRPAHKLSHPSLEFGAQG